MSEFFLGLDLGQASDFSALCVVEVVPIATGRTRIAVDGRSVPGSRPHEWIYERAEREVPVTEDRYDVRELRRWQLGSSYPQIVRDVAGLLEREPLCSAETTLAVDYTGVGRPVVDLFRQAELRAHLVPVTITGGDTPIKDGDAWRTPKRDLVGCAQVLLQNRRLRIAPALAEAATLVAELQAFQVKLSPAGHDSYGAWREGAHDDVLLAVALACWVAEHGRAPVYFAI
jgi:hypothetical protein